MTLVTPDKKIAIAGHEHILAGNFGTLKALQHAFARDIVEIQGGILTMRQDEIAKLIAIAITASPPSPTTPNDEDIGQWIIDEVDVTSVEYIQLKATLMSWLMVALTPKRDREKKSAEIEEILAPSSFPGTNISGSLPASSAGQ